MILINTLAIDLNRPNCFSLLVFNLVMFDIAQRKMAAFINLNNDLKKAAKRAPAVRSL